MPIGERATHYLHPYPASCCHKYQPSSSPTPSSPIPGTPCSTPSAVRGPCRSSILHGRRALGADANPLARLIANVKVSDCVPEAIRRHQSTILRRARGYRLLDHRMSSTSTTGSTPTSSSSRRLRRAIDAVGDPDIGDFVRVCLSACVRRVAWPTRACPFPCDYARTSTPRATHSANRATRDCGSSVARTSSPSSHRSSTTMSSESARSAGCEWTAHGHRS